MVIGRLIDMAVAALSPVAGLRRQQAREVLTRSAMYAAAKNSLSTGEWQPADSRINTIIANSLPNLRARARQLVRDMPAMATAINRIEEFTVGSGITMQARVKDPDSGKLARAVNQKIEDVWNWWCDEADDGGRLHFTEIQQLFARSEAEIGEYVAIKKLSRSSGRMLPLSLLLMEPDNLLSWAAGNSAATDALPGNEVSQGVEYDPRTGRALAYHFEAWDRFKKPLRVPADQVVHGFRTLRPGQLRGVTPLAPVILMAQAMRDFLEATLSTAQKSARWLAFVTSADPAATMAAFGAAASPTYSDSAGNRKYTMEMGMSVIDFLHTGEDVKIADHNQPGDTFTPFIRFLLQSFASSCGLTYELISGDYSGAVYTAARVARNDMLKGIGVRRARLLRQFCEQVRREVIDWAVLTGKLDLPGYFANRRDYLRCVWVDPGTELLDPMREGRAEAEAIKGYTRSPQDVLISKGDDPEKVLDEIQEWRQMLADRGLPLPEEIDGRLPLKSNPAAVAGQKADGFESAAMRRIK